VRGRQASCTVLAWSCLSGVTNDGESEFEERCVGSVGMAMVGA